MAGAWRQSWPCCPVLKNSPPSASPSLQGLSDELFVALRQAGSIKGALRCRLSALQAALPTGLLVAVLLLILLLLIPLHFVAALLCGAAATPTQQPSPACPSTHPCAEYKTGETFWLASDAVHSSGGLEGPGMFVVLSGVIRRVHHRPDGTKKVQRRVDSCG